MKKSTLLFIPAFLITGIALFYAWTDWSGARQLKESLAMLDAKKETRRFEDFLPAPVPDERNVAAAPIFKEFCDALRLKQNDSRLAKLKEPWTNSDLKQEEGESWLHFQARKIDPSFKGDENAAGKIILKSLAQLDPTIKEISEALKRPDAVWPLDYSIAPYSIQLPQLSILNRTARIFYAKALAEMATGAPEKSFEDTQTLLAIARASKEPPFLICELVEVASLNLVANVIHQALNEGSWSNSQLAMISAELPQFRLMSQYANALRVERACLASYSTAEEIKESFLLQKSAADQDVPIFVWKESLNLAIYRLRPSGWENDDRALSIVILQRMIDSLNNGDRLSSIKIWDEVQRKNNLHGWQFTKTPITLLVMPPYGEAVKKICQTQTRLNVLSAACAVERFRLANHQLPASLDELVPSLLTSVPKDPMTGAPLLYKRMQGMAVSDGQKTATPAENFVGMSNAKSSLTYPDDSFVIYGLGWNRKDDGGPKVSTLNREPQEQSTWGIVVNPTK